MNVLSIEGLHKRFGSQTVLDSLDLQVARGEIVGLLGPNGCGKSTTLNIVCGLLEADAGQVRIGGEPVSSRTAARVGLCPQASALYRDLLPAENLDFFARLYGLADLRSELAFLLVFCISSMGLGVSSYRHLLKLEKHA